MNNPSLFTHAHVIPNLYGFVSLLEHKRRSFEERTFFTFKLVSCLKVMSTAKLLFPVMIELKVDDSVS